MGNFKTSWVLSFKDNVSKAALKVAASTERMRKGFKASQQSINQMGMQGNKSLSDLQKQLRGLRSALRHSTDPRQQQQLAASIRTTTKEMSRLNAQMRGIPTGPLGKLKAGFKSLATSIPGGHLLTNPLFAVTAATGLAIREASLYEDQMADLSAITGISGKKLEGLGDVAIKQSNAFGTSAASNIESFKLILSQLGPGIADSSEALDAMTTNVNTLSKASGLDATESTLALTTAMQQFGVSMDDPIAASKIMRDQLNTMAAGAQAGAAEIPAIKDALQKAGSVAKGTNISFEETTAAIEVLATAGLQGADAGTPLRNVLGDIARATGPAADKLKAYGVDVAKLTDLSQPLNVRLKALAPIAGDVGKTMDVFGKQNFVAANALITNISALEDFTKQVTGTNTAFDQAAVKQATFSEMINKLKQNVLNFAIRVGQKLIPVIKLIIENFDLLKVPITVVAGLIAGKLTSSFLGWIGMVPKFTSGMSLASLSVKGFGNALKGILATNPFGWLLLGISLVIQFRDEINSTLKAAVNLAGISTDDQDKIKFKKNKVVVSSKHALTDINLAEKDKKFFQERLLKQRVGNLIPGRGGISFSGDDEALGKKRLAELDRIRTLVGAKDLIKRAETGKLSAKEIKELKAISKDELGVAQSTRNKALKALSAVKTQQLKAKADSVLDINGGGGAPNLGGATSELGATFAAGATQTRNVIVNITAPLVGELTIMAQGLKEGAANATDIVKRAMVDMIRDAEVALD